MSQASVLPLLPADAAGTLPVAEKEASVTVAELDSPPVEADRRPEESDPAVPVFDLAATHLVSSPYPDVANQLDLRSLATPVRLLAFALSVLAPIRSDYATAPYLESFNWPEVFHALRTLCSRAGVQWQRQEFYLVIFRSQLRRDIDRGRLGELDQRSHEEACASGGLLKYWFGSCDADMRNLATCKYHTLPKLLRTGHDR